MMKRDPLTGDLFSWACPQIGVGYEVGVAGRGNLENQIARLVGRALRDARDESRGSRDEIARRMSAQLGRAVSKALLDKWSSESSGDHRIPLDAFAALIEATGATDLLGFLPSLFGFAVVPERYRDIIELHLIDEHERDIAARKAALQARMRGKR
jgi:hypothetical protein